MRTIHIAAFSILLHTGCWPSVREDILDSFTRVHDSLEAGRTRSEQHVTWPGTELPPVPFADLGCPEFQARSDSMAMALTDVEQAMAPIFRDLAGVAQGNRTAGDSAFMNAGHGALLFSAISKAYDIASAIAPDDSTRTRIREDRPSAVRHSTVEAWRAAEFTDVPRAAVVTILSKARGDLENLHRMCDNALLRACMDKN